MRFATLMALSAALLLTSIVSVGAYDLEYSLDEHGRILIPVKFESGQSFNYLLTTNNRRIGVRADTVDDIGVKPIYRTTIREYSPRGMIRLPGATLPDMYISGQKLSDRYAVIYPKNVEVMGAIGYDGFGENLLHIKPDEQTISVYPHAGAISGEGWALATGQPNHYGGIVLQATYRGVDLNVVIDSSISTSIVSVSAARKLNLEYDPVGHSDFTHVAMGMSTFNKALHSINLPDLRVGEWNLGDVEVLVSRQSSKEAANSKNPDLLVLGSDILAQNELVLDFRNFQVWYPSAQ